MIAIVVLIVLALLVTGLWLWKSRGRIAPPAANNPGVPTVTAPDGRARVMQGLEGLNLGDINSELQDINKNSAK